MGKSNLKKFFYACLCWITIDFKIWEEKEQIFEERIIWVPQKIWVEKEVFGSSVKFGKKRSKLQFIYQSFNQKYKFSKKAFIILFYYSTSILVVVNGCFQKSITFIVLPKKYQFGRFQKSVNKFCWLLISMESGHREKWAWENRAP